MTCPTCDVSEARHDGVHAICRVRAGARTRHHRERDLIIYPYTPILFLHAQERVALLSELPGVSPRPALEPSAISNVVRTFFRVFHALACAPRDTGGVFHQFQSTVALGAV